jgi:hypothetical protein
LDPAFKIIIEKKEITPMAMKKRHTTAPKPASQEKPATLKDLLSEDVLNKLKAQSDELKKTEEKKKEDVRKQALEAQSAEKKRLENDFEHLLSNSSQDWKKYK